MYGSLRNALFMMVLAAVAPGVVATDAELAVALERLQAGELAQRRAQEDLRARVAAGTIDPDGRTDYEFYLRGLQSTVAALRVEVARLQGFPFASSPGAVVQANAPESPDQRVSRLDASLQKSVGDFDEMLLREREALSRKRAATGGGGAAGQGDGQSGSARRGQNTSQTGGEDSDQNGPQGGVIASGQEGAEGQAQGTLARAPGSSIGRGGSRSGAPADVPDGRDDDVVARQLREAAESEKDPALRERLWDEYRRYKATSR